MMTTETATNQPRSASTLSEDQLRKITRIHGRATAYEITLTHSDGRSFMIGYTAQRSFSGLMNFLVSATIRPALVAVVGLTDANADDAKITRGIRSSLNFNNGWKVGFSGRTQREAIIEGEHPFLVRFLTQA